MNDNKNKKIMLSIIGIAILLVGLVGVTYSFFNYTRVGAINNIGTGRIYFNSSQSDTLNITNVFPIKESELDSSTLDEVTISIRGDTTYSEGEEYLISLAGLNNTINGKEIPMNYIAEVSNVGTSSDTYWESRGGNSSIYTLDARGKVKEGKQVLVGYITSGATGINGTLKIKAYVDADRIAISDTYDGQESDNNGTTNDWVNERTVLTTTEWNSLQGNNAISFKIRVESNEGVWVERVTTPESCFNTRLIKVYSLNPNMNDSQMSECISLFQNESFDDGTSVEDYCRGIGTINGMTFNENEFYEKTYNIIEDHEIDGIINSTEGLEIISYDGTCGSDVIIPSNMNYTHLMRNADMSNDQLNVCTNYFLSKAYLNEYEEAENFCNGIGTLYGYTFDELINHYTYIKRDEKYLRDEGIIVNGSISKYDVLSIGDDAVIGISDYKTPLNDSTFMNITSLVLPNRLKYIGRESFYIEYGYVYPKNIIIPESVEYIEGSAFFILEESDGVTIPNTTLAILGKPYVGVFSIPDYNTIIYGGTCAELNRGSYSTYGEYGYIVNTKGPIDQTTYAITTDSNQCELKIGYA